jgi:hypothetical protein
VYSDWRSAAQSSGASGTSQGLSQPLPMMKSTLLLIGVGTTVTAKTVSSITATSGTFTNVAVLNGATGRVEIWLGRNFTDSLTGVTVNFNQSAGGYAIVGLAIDVSSNLTSAPTITASAGNNATSTAPDTNTVTPAVDDILVAAASWLNGTASTARTSTGNTFINDTEQAQSTNLTLALSWCKASAASSSSLAWTITSASWQAILGRLQMAADPAASAALVAKGMTTAALDAASSF